MDRRLQAALRALGSGEPGAESRLRLELKRAGVHLHSFFIGGMTAGIPPELMVEARCACGRGWPFHVTYPAAEPGSPWQGLTLVELLPRPQLVLDADGRACQHLMLRVGPSGRERYYSLLVALDL